MKERERGLVKNINRAGSTHFERVKMRGIPQKLMEI